MINIYRSWKWFTIREEIKNIKLLILDIDGVLTDGGIWLNNSGKIQRRFDVRDGLGLKLLIKSGLTIAFMSGGIGRSTKKRAEQLGIHYCLTEVKDKSLAVGELQKKVCIGKINTAFVGDDLNDLVVRKQVKILISPSDACKEIKSQSDAVLNRGGGDGAVRELAERILLASGRLQEIFKKGWKESNV